MRLGGSRMLWGETAVRMGLGRMRELLTTSDGRGYSLVVCVRAVRHTISVCVTVGGAIGLTIGLAVGSGTHCGVLLQQSTLHVSFWIVL